MPSAVLIIPYVTAFLTQNTEEQQYNCYQAQQYATFFFKENPMSKCLYLLANLLTTRPTRVDTVQESLQK